MGRLICKMLETIYMYIWEVKLILDLNKIIKKLYFFNTLTGFRKFIIFRRTR